jgi:hypothetical protein
MKNRKLPVLFLLLISLPLIYAENCTLSVASDSAGNIFAETVYDDDGSIQFVDLFVSEVTVTQYSFENVPEGTMLLESVSPAAEVSFSYSDYDGTMSCIGVFGSISEPDAYVPMPILISNVWITPRLAEDNLSIFLDIIAEAAAGQQVSSMSLDYSFSPSGGVLSMPLSGENRVYRATLGPFRKKISLYPVITATDITGAVQPVSLKPHFFEVVTSDENVCAEVVSAGFSPLRHKERPVAASLAEAESSMSLHYDDGLLYARDVYDDDGSIQQLIIHVVGDGMEMNYDYGGVVEGQSFSVTLPEGAFAYYNYSDYDGSISGWGLLQPITYGTPAFPEKSIDLIKEARVDAVPNKSFTSFSLEFTLTPEEEAEIADSYVKYSYSPNSYTEDLYLDYNAGNGTHSAGLGPFFNEFTLYSRAVAQDFSGNYDSLDLGVRWYRLVPPDEIKCIDIVDGNLGTMPDLFIRNDGIPPFVVFEDSLTISPVVKNSGVTDAGPFFVALLINGELVDAQLVEGLAVGQQQAVAFEFDPAPYLGENEAGILADYFNDVAELNENNNSATKPLIVGYNNFNVIMNYNNTEVVADEREMLVLDRFGRGVQGAAVTVQNPQGETYSFTTGRKGIVSFPINSTGNYFVEVSKKDFQAFSGSFPVLPLDIRFRKLIPSGAVQEITVLSPSGLPVADASVKVTAPDGAEELLKVSERGAVSFRAAINGTYHFEIVRKDMAIVLESFVSAGIIEVTLGLGGEGLELIVGQELLGNPELLLLLIAMCFVAAFIAYSKSRILFRRGAKSTRQKKIEYYIRVSLAVAFFFIPLQTGKYFGFTAAVFFVLLEIILFILADYWHQKVVKGRKAIKVLKRS